MYSDLIDGIPVVSFAVYLVFRARRVQPPRKRLLRLLWKPWLMSPRRSSHQAVSLPIEPVNKTMNEKYIFFLKYFVVFAHLCLY